MYCLGYSSWNFCQLTINRFKQCSVAGLNFKSKERNQISCKVETMACTKDQVNRRKGRIELKSKKKKKQRAIEKKKTSVVGPSYSPLRTLSLCLSPNVLWMSAGICGGNSPFSFLLRSDVNTDWFQRTGIPIRSIDWPGCNHWDVSVAWLDSWER